MNRDEMAAQIYLTGLQELKAGPLDTVQDTIKRASNIARGAFLYADVFFEVKGKAKSRKGEKP